MFLMRLLLTSGIALTITACANLTLNNVFSHYSAQNQAVHSALEQGEYQQAQEGLAVNIAGDILDNLEKGRVYWLNNHDELSFSALKRADLAAQEQQDKARFSLGSALTSTASLAVNDSLNDYIPADYELGFMHLYLGLSYLKRNQLESALVEMRRANQVQEQAKKQREDELDKAHQQAQQYGITTDLQPILGQYSGVSDTLQAIQNGYLFLLSALLYEADGELNSAYVDYRRALAVAPDNPAVATGALRVAKRLGMQEDAQLLHAHYQAQTIGKGQGRVIILAETGVVSALQSWKMTLPIVHQDELTFYSLSLPYYPDQPKPPWITPVSLQFNQDKMDLHLLSDVNLMAKYHLSENIVNLVWRQVLRLVVKEQMRRQIAGDNELTSLLVNLFNDLSEQADTRSWLSLPAQVYTSSQVVEAGEQQIHIADQNYTFSVPEAGTTLVWLSYQGQHARIWHKQLGKLE